MAEHKEDSPFLKIRANGPWYEALITDRDGNPIEDVAAVTWEMRAGSPAKVTVEFFRADIEVQGATDLLTCGLCDRHVAPTDMAARCYGKQVCKICLGTMNSQAQRREEGARRMAGRSLECGEEAEVAPAAS